MRALTDEDTLARLQREQVPWVQHNFPGRPAWMPLLGAQEELGELAHAHLKHAQGIRTGEDHKAAKADALADIVIYLADYATAEGIDLQAVVAETWDRVKQRDWKADPANGAAPCPPEVEAEIERQGGRR